MGRTLLKDKKCIWYKERNNFVRIEVHTLHLTLGETKKLNKNKVLLSTLIGSRARINEHLAMASNV
jgi:hypothetical protein